MDDAQRLAYEERREDERRQEREREEAYREELEQEDARRLARYDEAVSIVQRYYTECMRQGILFGPINGDAADFLAAEGRK